MRNKILKLLILILVLFGFLSGTPFVFSQTSSIDAEINELNLKIQNQKKQIEELKIKQSEYQTQIEAKRRDRITLNNQLALIETRLAKAQLDIDSVNLEIDKTNLEIQKTEIEANNLDTRIEEGKQHITNLLRLVYKQDQMTTIEMLLLNESLSDFLNQAKYLEDTNKEIKNSVEELRADKDRLDNNKKILNKKNEELLALKKQLKEREDSLHYEQENKTYILEETKSSEKQYQELLARVKREQEQAAAEISSAESLIRKKMSQKDQQRLQDGNNNIDWPVPRNKITSSFHDIDYPYRKIIGEHSGVDIRAAQGTTITAAADGYVAKVKFDGSKNYAYIMLIHGDGLATVYGHVSAVYVTVDQYVVQGQAIGRSGGTPGTTGAGSTTTGPHLHFEVRKDGLPVNPENYLP
ncbi:peptidoglycan DD-metalloendopeptidase family protein [Candidatus Falkowbacteria bacterium]|jgi:murein DD-endopeptidase MepM/ murein hydrolase activator NlpD|nr:peptidoglycan DD-metalloendopeptidase family protein [Candidatus Falkowbacteria bacterium]